MIAKHHRFHGHGSLNFVYRKGHVIRGEYISLRIAPSRDTDYRMAVVVSKKVSKLAVVRNRIRRRLYEVVRLQSKAAQKAWPYDLVFSVFDDRAAHASNEELTAVVEKLLQKADL